MTGIQFQLFSDNQSVLEEHSPYIKNRSHPPINVNEVKIVDLFSGIGGFHIGFEHAGAKLGIGLKLQFASDIDEAANGVYENNFGEKPLGDINDIGDTEADDADLICGGFPCQPFSNSGMKKGFSDDRGTLFDHIERMIKASRPKAFLLENVAGILHNGKGHTANSRLHADGHAKRIGTTMQQIEERLSALYDYQSSWAQLDSSAFGSPQVRRRVFMVGIHRDLNYDEFSFPNGSKQLNTMRSVLESEFSEKHVLSDNQDANIREDMLRKKRPTYRDGMRRVGQAYHCPGGNVGQAYHVDGLVPTLTVVWSRFMPLYFPHEMENVPSDPYQESFNPGPFYGKGQIRRATPRETLRLQGFPDDFRVGTNEADTYRQAGNAVNCNVIREIAMNLLPIIS